MRAGLLSRVAAASGAVTVAPMAAGRGVAPLADVPDRERRDGPPELVIRRKHPVVAMPVLARRRDEIGEPVKELKRRELHDTIGSRPRGLPAAAGPDPVGCFMPREHVADLGDRAVWAADHGESLECEGRPGAVSQQMLKTLKIAVPSRDRDRRRRRHDGAGRVHRRRRPRQVARRGADRWARGGGRPRGSEATPAGGGAVAAVCRGARADIRPRPPPRAARHRRHSRLPLRGRGGWPAPLPPVVARGQAHDADRDGPVPGVGVRTGGGHALRLVARRRPPAAHRGSARRPVVSPGQIAANALFRVVVRARTSSA